MNTSDRIARLRDALQDEGLDAILVSSRENRHYLSGFTGSAGYLLVSHEQAVLATDFRYVEQARGQAVDFRVLKDSGKGHWLKKTLEQTAVNRVGFEAQYLTVSAHSALTKALGHPETQNGIELVETQDLLDKIRVTKSSEELGHMAVAGRRRVAAEDDGDEAPVAPLHRRDEVIAGGTDVARLDAVHPFILAEQLVVVAIGGAAVGEARGREGRSTP